MITDKCGWPNCIRMTGDTL